MFAGFKGGDGVFFMVVKREEVEDDIDFGVAEDVLGGCGDARDFGELLATLTGFNLAGMKGEDIKV
jgi:hypothetical protein